MKKNILVCLGTDVFLIVLYILLVYLQIAIKLNRENLPSFPIFNVFLNNLAFYAVPMIACLSFSVMRRLLKNAAKINRTIRLNAVILLGLGIITDAGFMGFDTFHFIQFIILTVLLHILLSFQRKGSAGNQFQ